MPKNHPGIDVLFEKLRSISSPPTEADFEAIEANQSELVPLLLEELEGFADAPGSIKSLGNDYIRHVVSIFILAYLRNENAYPHLIKLISHPGDNVIKLTGEVFTEALGRILASVYSGDIEPIKAVVENPAISPWIRSGALDSMMVLWKENVIERHVLVEYLRELMEGKLEPKPSYVWDGIALIAFDLHPGGIEDLLLKAIRKKLIAPMVLDEDSLRRCVKENLSDNIKNKEKVVDGYIKEPIKELTWWLYPDQDVLDKGMEYASVAVPITEKKIIPGERAAPIGWRADTVEHRTKKLGRNDPCYCGSGKKYKKCCGVN